MEHYFYVGVCDTDGGILHFKITGQGKLQLLDKTLLDRPMYLYSEGSKLYALMREAFPMQSGVAEFEIQTDGSLVRHGDITPTHGAVSCHIVKFKGSVYTANYLSGSVTRLPNTVAAYSGKGPQPQQDCSHPHCITPTPDGKYLCVCDLGGDCIHICTEDLEEVERVSVRAGSGPRHLIFSGDGKYAYCANEVSSEVSAFTYEDGTLKFVDSVRSVPDDFEGVNYPAAIRLDAGKLYVSNRGHDSVCVLDAEGTALSNKRFITSGGTSPREMNVIGKWVLCGNSSCLTVCDKNTGEQTDSVELKGPWSIIPSEM